MHGHRLVQRAVPLQLSGGSLRSGSIRLALPGKPPRGHDSLVIRLLETTANGAAQGSVLLTDRLSFARAPA
jgi:hypothetical protein